MFQDHSPPSGQLADQLMEIRLEENAEARFEKRLLLMKRLFPRLLEKETQAQRMPNSLADVASLTPQQRKKAMRAWLAELTNEARRVPASACETTLPYQPQPEESSL